MNLDQNIQFLVDILSLRTYTGQEQEVINYVTSWCLNHKHELNLNWFVDELGNVYITKENPNTLTPLIIGHSDSVHRLQEKEIVIDEENEVMYAIDPTTGEPIGCGGDDLVSIFCGLKLLENPKISNLKVCFYVSEEPGCLGSQYSVINHPKFYTNISYVIMVDSPFGEITEVCSGTRLFNPEGKFFKTIEPIIYGMFPETKRKNHPYTDIRIITEHLRDKGIGVESLNFCGFYSEYHTRYEKVHYVQLFKGLECLEKMISELGTKTYEYF